MITALLLFISNIFTTLARNGHLKFKDKPLWLVIVASWTLAFFEYFFRVPLIASARLALALSGSKSCNPSKEDHPCVRISACRP
jgi:uncharacterized protein (DUF486 family)